MEVSKNLSERVQNNLDRIEKFLNNRETLMPAFAIKEVKEIKAETQNIFTVGFHTNKGDIEMAFYECRDNMILLQFNTMMFLSA